MIFLEINDWQLNARRADGTLLFSEPAAASSALGPLVFGEAAINHSRTFPQKYNHKYFYSLAADPIPGDLGPAKNHADLIYHHLRQLELPKDEDIALCVGGHLTNQQLGLLLGITKEVGLRVCGFLDNALGQSLHLPASASYYVLDLELHRLVLSHISVDGDLRTVSQATTFDGMGASQIIDGWMNVIADEFVQKTRFDPLHAGDSEQQVFDQVLRWMSKGEMSDQRINIAYTDANRDIEVSAKLLREKLRQRLGALDLGHVDQLMISPKIAALPGLQVELQQRLDQIHAIEADHLAANYLKLAEQLEADSIRRIISAHVGTPAPVAVDAASTPQKAPASHLLNEHVAFPLDDALFHEHIDAAASATRSLQITVNGTAALQQPLFVGDQVDLNGTTYTAIRVK